ncbi:MAG TPA: hypothetical protein DF614_07690 [Methylococcaceae bacterium]|nr:hypothetical protein [Methylococcaceae bacterium]
MKKLAIAFLLTVGLPVLAENQTPQQASPPQQPTNVQPQDAKGKSPQSTKDATPSIIDFCRTHTC